MCRIHCIRRDRIHFTRSNVWHWVCPYLFMTCIIVLTLNHWLILLLAWLLHCIAYTYILNTPAHLHPYVSMLHTYFVYPSCRYRIVTTSLLYICSLQRARTVSFDVLFLVISYFYLIFLYRERSILCEGILTRIPFEMIFRGIFKYIRFDLPWNIRFDWIDLILLTYIDNQLIFVKYLFILC